MPTYTYHREATDEVWDEFWPYDTHEQFLKDNVDVKRVFVPIAIVSGVSGITHKNDSGFKDVMTRIADANPHTPMAQTHGDKGVKASKVREAVNKERVRQHGST
jgi:hypothetical protein